MMQTCDEDCLTCERPFCPGDGTEEIGKNITENINKKGTDDMARKGVCPECNDGKEKTIVAKGLCYTHYMKARKSDNPKPDTPAKKRKPAKGKAASLAQRPETILTTMLEKYNASLDEAEKIMALLVSLREFGIEFEMPEKHVMRAK